MPGRSTCHASCPNIALSADPGSTGNDFSRLPLTPLPQPAVLAAAAHQLVLKHNVADDIARLRDLPVLHYFLMQMDGGCKGSDIARV